MDSNSLGNINIQRDDYYLALKNADERLVVVFDHETTSGTSYKFNISETSDIKSFNLELLNQHHQLIDFTNKIKHMTAQLAFLFLVLRFYKYRRLFTKTKTLTVGLTNKRVS